MSLRNLQYLVSDLAGNPLIGATVTCDLAVPAALTSTGVIVPGELVTLTNASGIAAFSVYANADLTPANTSYVLTVHHTTLVPVSIVVPSGAYNGARPTYFDVVLDNLIVAVPATPGNYQVGPTGAQGPSGLIALNAANTFTAPQTIPLVDRGGTVYNATGAIAANGSTDDQAALTSFAGTIPSGGTLQLPASTIVQIASTFRIPPGVNLDLNHATLRYTGSSVALDCNVAGGATNRNDLLRVQNGTVDLTTAGGGAIGVRIDNVSRSKWRNVWVNGNGVSCTALQLLGSAAKSTYFNAFHDCDFSADTAVVTIGDQCNANEFWGGVWEGGAAATGLTCNPTTSNSGQCKFFSVSLQTGGAALMSLGTGAAYVQQFEFHGCRFEPTNPASLTLGAEAYDPLFVGGIYASVTISDSTPAGHSAVFLMSPGVGAGGLGTLKVGPNTIQNTSTGVNGTLLKAADTGQAAQIVAQGQDTNIGWYLLPKGTGAVRVADSTVTYINELTDSAGNATFSGAVRTQGTSTSTGFTAGYGAATNTVYAAAAVAIGGSVTNQNLYVDAKGTGAIAFNTQNGATGGVQVQGGSVDVTTAGKGLKVAEGSNAKQGLTAALAGTPGTLVVANTSITANSRVMLTRATPGGTLGHISVTVIASTSFTILSTANETSTFNFQIFEPG